MKATNLFVVLILSVLLFGCDELTGSSTGANKIIVSASKTKKADAIKEVGGLAYVEVSPKKIRLLGTMDKGGTSAHNFNLTVKLEDNKQGTFYFFATKSLSHGILLKFEKANNKASITLTINDTPHTFVKDLASDNILQLSIDIHNDHEDAHIVMWDINGPFSDDGLCFYYETCFYNTESYTPPNDDDGPWGSHGKGPGIFWGFEGDKEIIIEVKGPLKPISNA